MCEDGQRAKTRHRVGPESLHHGHGWHRRISRATTCNPLNSAVWSLYGSGSSLGDSGWDRAPAWQTPADTSRACTGVWYNEAQGCGGCKEAVLGPSSEPRLRGAALSWPCSPAAAALLVQCLKTLSLKPSTYARRKGTEDQDEPGSSGASAKPLLDSRHRSQGALPTRNPTLSSGSHILAPRGGPLPAFCSEPAWGREGRKQGVSGLRRQSSRALAVGTQRPPQGASVS